MQLSLFLSTVRDVSPFDWILEYWLNLIHGWEHPLDVLSNYSKGRNLEYAAKRRLEESGFTVFRCASSKPVDLVAVKQGLVMLVQCKTGLKPYVSKEELEKTLTLAMRAGGKAVLCFRKKFQRLHFYEVLSGFEKRELTI